jgi:hypothetical protein
MWSRVLWKVISIFNIVSSFDIALQFIFWKDLKHDLCAVKNSTDTEELSSCYTFSYHLLQWPLILLYISFLHLRIPANSDLVLHSLDYPLRFLWYFFHYSFLQHLGPLRIFSSPYSLQSFTLSFCLFKIASTLNRVALYQASIVGDGLILVCKRVRS